MLPLPSFPSRLRARRLRRYPTLWWVIVLGLAAFIGLTVSQALVVAESVTARYGTTVPVLVAQRPLAPGTVIRAADVRVDEWPPAFLPGGASTTGVVGRVVTVALVAGEPLLEAKVAPNGRSPLVALLRPDERGVAIPVDTASPPLEVGDHVEVVAAFDGQTDSTSVASGRVLSVAERSVMVAVPLAEVAATTAAISKATVLLTLAPAPPQHPSPEAERQHQPPPATLGSIGRSK